MDLARLRVDLTFVDDVPVVETEGELNSWTVQDFERALVRAADGGGRMVVVDLTRVQSLDVGALRVLQQVCSRLGPDRKLCAVACGQARRTLEMTRFDEIISIYPKLQQALDTG